MAKYSINFWQNGVTGIPAESATSGAAAKAIALDYLRDLRTRPHWRLCQYRKTERSDGSIFRELIHPACGVVAYAVIRKQA